MLGKSRTGIGVGTPARLMDLMENGETSFISRTLPTFTMTDISHRGTFHCPPKAHRGRCVSRGPEEEGRDGHEGYYDTSCSTPFEEGAYGEVWVGGSTVGLDLLLNRRGTSVRIYLSGPSAWILGARESHTLRLRPSVASASDAGKRAVIDGRSTCGATVGSTPREEGAMALIPQ